ncbi:hypothetical protein WMF31_00805 [Sorangium sp. So ce1036]|uniref:hypothetical protein n=1 Tax=Sorangium sp. So ce1036 TaxID=3133328 RepID=UPI003F00E254
MSKSEALALERQERNRLEVSLKLGVTVPKFEEFAKEFVETYAVTNLTDPLILYGKFVDSRAAGPPLPPGTNVGQSFTWTHETQVFRVSRRRTRENLQSLAGIVSV